MRLPIPSRSRPWSAIALLASLFACDIHDDAVRGDVRPGATGAGTLTPRIQAQMGVLAPCDSVHLRLRLVDGQGAPELVAKADLPWSVKSATLTGVPLNRQWRLEVWGTTGSDTLWYGTDTGTLLDSGNLSRSTSSPSVVVKNFARAPAVFWKGLPLQNGARVMVGDTILVKAPDSTALGIGSDGARPDCFPGDPGEFRLVMAWEGSYNLTAVACADSLWDSRMLDVGWTAQVRDSISLLTHLDSAQGTWRDWTSPVRMATSNGLPVVWRAIASGDTSTPQDADWSALDASSAPRREGSEIDSNLIRALVDSALASTDSTGRILVKAWVVRGGVPVDSIRFWWKLHLPSVRRPVVTHTRGFGNVRFSWVKSDAREIRAWIGLGGTWTPAAIQTDGPYGYCLASGLGSGQLARLRLVAVDPTSGRTSDTLFDSAMSRNPPPVPRFTVVNSRTDSAYVTLTLGAHSGSIEGVSWSVAFGRSYSQQMSFTQVADLATTPWTRQVGEGTFVFAVRAIRDDSATVDTQWCEVAGLAANRPQMPQNLRLVRRTTDSLYWEWDANPDRGYLVHWGSDPGQEIVQANGADLEPGTGRFARRLGPGDSSWIAVFAKPGGDSTAGVSLGAFSGTARTRSVPAPVTDFGVAVGFGADFGVELVAKWTALPGLRYVVYDSTSALDTTVVGQESLRWSLSDTSRSGCDISIRALNSDSALSDPVSVAVSIPRVRGFDPAAWSTWVGSRSVNFRLEWAVSGAPDSLRIVAPWTLDGARLDTVVAFPQVGGSRALEHDSVRLRASPSLQLQYLWKNGDRSPLGALALDFQPPSLGMRFDVASGAGVDTVLVAHSAPPAGWSLDYRIHSLAKGWESRSTTGRYGSGVDSIRWRLVRDQTGSGDATAYATAGVDHRKRVEVVHRDGSRAEIWTTRIGGRTWMSQNLSYDIPGDSLDMCFSTDPAKCAIEGRRYSVSQIFGAPGGSACDTVDWDGRTTPGCQIATPSICPVGWRLPDNFDWEALRGVANGIATPSLRTGKWPIQSRDQVDPFGFHATWPTWCYRQGGEFGCYDTSLGTAYPSSDPGFPGTIHVAYFDTDASTPFSVALVAYYNATDVPRAPSYFPVRCVKE